MKISGVPNNLSVLFTKPPSLIFITINAPTPWRYMVLKQFKKPFMLCMHKCESLVPCGSLEHHPHQHCFTLYAIDILHFNVFTTLVNPTLKGMPLKTGEVDNNCQHGSWAILITGCNPTCVKPHSVGTFSWDKPLCMRLYSCFTPNTTV